MTSNQGSDLEQVRLWRMTLQYLTLILIGNLVWEFAHMPLYEIWSTGTRREIIFAGLHCTGGDILIAGSALMTSTLVFGRGCLTSRNTVMKVAVTTIILGLSYTIFSEYLNITIRKSWAYSDLMPVIPVINMGLSPFMQWLILPMAAFWHSARYLFRRH